MKDHFSVQKCHFSEDNHENARNFRDLVQCLPPFFIHEEVKILFRNWRLFKKRQSPEDEHSGLAGAGPGTRIRGLAGGGSVKELRALKKTTFQKEKKVLRKNGVSKKNNQT